MLGVEWIVNAVVPLAPAAVVVADAMRAKAAVTSAACSRPMSVKMTDRCTRWNSTTPSCSSNRRI
jgi:hypothetical protein